MVLDDKAQNIVRQVDDSTWAEIDGYDNSNFNEKYDLTQNYKAIKILT